MEMRRGKTEGGKTPNMEIKFPVCNYTVYSATIEGLPLWTPFSLTTGLEKKEAVVEVLSVTTQHKAEAHMG